MKYKFLPHTADIKFQAFGEKLGTCFSNAALAITNIITKDKIKPNIKKTIKVKGKDFESLLYNFLEEFLFLFETKRFLLSKIINISIFNKAHTKQETKDNTNKNNKSNNYDLKAEIIGDNQEHELSNHIKAITYNDMFVKKQKDKFICQVVVDV